MPPINYPTALYVVKLKISQSSRWNKLKFRFYMRWMPHIWYLVPWLRKSIFIKWPTL